VVSLQARPFSSPEIRYKILIKMSEVYTNLGHSEQAIEIAEDILNSEGPVDIDIFVRAHLVVAEANEVSGQYDKAITHASIVYDMAQTEQIDDAWTAQVTSKLSSYYAFNHDYKKALEFGRKAVASNLELHGETHIETAKALGGLGLALLELEQLSESEQVLTSALHIYRNQLHPEDLEISNTRLLLGIVKYKYGKAQEAIEILEPAVTNLKQALGDSHPDYIAALNNLTVVYAMTGQWENTLKNMSQVVDYMKNEAGVGSKAYLMPKMNLGVPMMQLGQFGDARNNWLEVLTLAKRHTPDDSLIIGEAHRWLAMLSLHQETFETGWQHATESVQRLKIAFPGHHTKTFNALLNLAVVESELENYEQSEKAAVEAIIMGETLPSLGRWRLSLANAIQAFSLFKQTAEENHKKTFIKYFNALKEEGGTRSIYFKRVESWFARLTTS
jgi:tetratricopeptide (TPR) repeat protein